MLFNSIRLVFAFLIIFFMPSCDKDVSVSPHTEDKFNSFNLILTSNPTGADIYIDNKYYGRKTPDTIRWIGAGERKVNLKLKYFKDFSLSITAKKDEEKMMNLDFFSMPDVLGKVEFKSNLNSDSVFANSKFIGITPLTLEYIPGRYMIEFKKKNHFTEQNIIEIYSGKESFCKIDLFDSTFVIPFYKKYGTHRQVYSLVNNDSEESFLFSSPEGIFTSEINGNIKSLVGQDVNITKEFIYCSYFSEKHGLLVASQNGINTISNSIYSKYNQINKLLINVSIRDIVEDTDGNLWLATTKGLWKYKNGVIKHYDFKNSEYNDNIINSVIFFKGNLYFTLDNELYKFEGEDKKLVQRMQSKIKKIYKCDNYIAIILAAQTDIKGNYLSPDHLYFLSNTELSYKKIFNFNSSLIHTIKTDKYKRVWVITSEGIKNYDPNGNQMELISQSIKNILDKYYLTDIIFKKGCYILSTSSYGIIKVKEGF